MSSLLLGCVADDFTGATDLALMLRREGMRTVQVIGVPASGAALPDADAIVIALKSRTAPVADAVAWSVASAEALMAAGARQLFFKYCSTFDSTDQGNIGPVADALMALLGADFTIACPAFPATGRAIYQGNLFVGGVPLNESPMKDHPLTPMRDANLVRVLARQTAQPVGLVGYADVDGGADAIRAAFERGRAAGTRIAIVDALSDAHLRAIGAAAADLKLITGGSGIAIGLPANFRAQGLLPERPVERFAAPAGRAIWLAGSCSAATRAQVARAIAAGVPTHRLDPEAIRSGTVDGPGLARWAADQPADGPVLIYSTAEPDAVRAAQASDASISQKIESILAGAAVGALAHGFRRFVVAGGETSGAVVEALGVTALGIGPEIAPGVPWTWSLGSRTGAPTLALALKSGNFGGPDFFTDALAKLA